MAASLRAVYATADGRKITHNFSCADVNATEANVKAFMEACVANKEIFVELPDGLVGAEFVVETVIPVSVD